MRRILHNKSTAILCVCKGVLVIYLRNRYRKRCRGFSECLRCGTAWFCERILRKKPVSAGIFVRPERRALWRTNGGRGCLRKNHFKRGVWQVWTLLPGFRGVYRAIRENLTPPVKAEEGLDVIRVINAAFQSSRENRVIEFKPARHLS